MAALLVGLHKGLSAEEQNFLKCIRMLSIGDELLRELLIQSSFLRGKNLEAIHDTFSRETYTRTSGKQRSIYQDYDFYIVTGTPEYFLKCPRRAPNGSFYIVPAVERLPANFPDDIVKQHRDRQGSLLSQRTFATYDMTLLYSAFRSWWVYDFSTDSFEQPFNSESAFYLTLTSILFPIK